MFDKYMVMEDSLRNVERDGEAVGYEFDVRIGYYRGVRLTLVEEISVTVDGEEIPRDRRTFSIDGHTYAFDDLDGVTDVRWEMGAPATIGVQAPGGLQPGEHTLAIRELIRISYGSGYTTPHYTAKIALQP